MLSFDSSNNNYRKKTKMEDRARASDLLQQFVLYLETYRGRDKVIRLANYALYLASGLLNRANGNQHDSNIGKLAAELSNLRVMLRLLDDVAMLQFTLSYGTGCDSEKDLMCRVCQFIQNCFDQLYYPVEHIAWARDTGILKGSSSKLWAMGTIFWVLSLSLGIIMSLRKLSLLRQKDMKNVQKGSFETDCNIQTEEHDPEEIRKKYMQLIVGLIGNIANLVNGIHWLPIRILWASKLPEEFVGLFGVISTLCSIYNSVT